MKKFLKAYLVYWCLYMGTVLTVSLGLDNSFGKLIATSWILSVVIVCSPLTVIRRLGIARLILLMLPFQFFTITLQMYVAYGIKGYKGSVFTAGSIQIATAALFYFALAFLCAFFAARLTKTAFSLNPLSDKDITHE